MASAPEWNVRISFSPEASQAFSSLVAAMEKAVDSLAVLAGELDTEPDAG